MQIELTKEQLDTLSDLIASKMNTNEHNIIDKNEVMTIKEVATYLQKSIISVRRYIRMPDFPVARKVGKEFRFSRKEVEEWFLNKKKKEAEKDYKVIK